MVQIPAGLAAGAVDPVSDSSVTLPSTPIPNVSSSGGTLYINAVVNPAHTIDESNYHNNEDLGPPYDTAAVLIQPPTPANLVGTTLAVTPTDPTWGSTITVTAQITNQSSGSSPQTRALLSLTPQGLTYGGSTTVGIGNIIVPPLGRLPDGQSGAEHHVAGRRAVIGLANYTNFGLTMTQDADYLTNDLYPNQPDQGIGLDQTAITITTSATSTATLRPSPTWPPRRSCSRRSTVQWGSTVQASTEVQNLGAGAAPPSNVFFVLTGQSGSLTDAIFLGETTLPALASGASQQINQTLQLPIRVAVGRDARQRRLCTHRGPHQSRKRLRRIDLFQRRRTFAAVHRAASRQRDHRADHAKPPGHFPRFQQLAIISKTRPRPPRPKPKQPSSRPWSPPGMRQTRRKNCTAKSARAA